MGSDLRTFLDEIDIEVLRIHKEVDPLTELGALCSQSGGPILFENIKGHPDWRVCDRLLGARKLQAAALRTTSDRLLQDAGTRIARGRGESRIVEDGPVKEVRIRGEDIDLQALPVWTAPGLLDTRVRVFDLMRPPQLERVFPALPGPAFGSRSPRESNDGCTGS